MKRKTKPDIGHQDTKSTKKIKVKIVFMVLNQNKALIGVGVLGTLVTYMSKFLKHYQQEVVFRIIGDAVALVL